MSSAQSKTDLRTYATAKGVGAPPLSGRINACVALAQVADRLLREAVDDARTAGVSWRDIGAMFDPPVSRQAVWERFGKR